MSKTLAAALTTFAVVIILTIMKVLGLAGEDGVLVGLLSGITYLLLLRRLELSGWKDQTDGE